MRGRAWGFGFGPGEWWWMGGKGRRRHQWFEAGDMKYVILKVLKDKPMHGYEVMKALEEQTHGCYRPSPGSVYPTLQWLEDEGLVKSQDVDGKKVYSITDQGRAFLEEHRSTVDDIFGRVAETIDRFMGEPMPEVNRSVGRLVGAAYRTAWRLGQDDAKKRKIVEILDRAAADIGALTP